MRQEMEQYRQLVVFLAKTLGNVYDVGLLDLTEPDYPALALSNSNGDAEEKVRDMLREKGDELVQKAERLVNRPVELEFDKLMKVSIFFVRDPQGTAVGALWVAMRCDIFFKMNAFVASMLQLDMTDLDDVQSAGAPGTDTPRELSLDGIAEEIRRFGVAPGRMTQSERQEVICDLYDMGFFNLKGAVARAAEELQLSEQSVYRYISKLKKARDW